MSRAIGPGSSWTETSRAEWTVIEIVMGCTGPLELSDIHPSTVRLGSPNDTDTVRVAPRSPGSNARVNSSVSSWRRGTRCMVGRSRRTLWRCRCAAPVMMLTFNDSAAVGATRSSIYPVDRVAELARGERDHDNQENPVE